MCNCCHGHLRKLIQSVLPYPVTICVFSMKTSIVVLHHVGRKQAKQGLCHFQWLAHRLSPKEVLICHSIKKKYVEITNHSVVIYNSSLLVLDYLMNWSSIVPVLNTIFLLAVSFESCEAKNVKVDSQLLGNNLIVWTSPFCSLWLECWKFYEVWEIVSVALRGGKQGLLENNL